MMEDIEVDDDVGRADEPTAVSIDDANGVIDGILSLCPRRI